MGIRNLTAAWKADISPTDKLVLLALADHANDMTGLCFPSIDTLATKTGFSGRTVSKAITSLEGQGYLKRNEVPGRVSRYDLFLPARHSTPEADSGVAIIPLNEAHPPANKMPPTPAQNSSHPRTTFTRTRREPENNPNEIGRAERGDRANPGNMDREGDTQKKLETDELVEPHAMRALIAELSRKVRV